MDKESLTTVTIDRSSFTKLDRLSKANKVTKKEFIAASLDYFEKYGINPVNHESPAQEMLRLIKRMDQLFAFMKKQEQDIVRPSCEVLGETAAKVNVKLDSLLTIESYNHTQEGLFKYIAEKLQIMYKSIDRSDTVTEKNMNRLFSQMKEMEARHQKAMSYMAAFIDAKNSSGLFTDISKLYSQEKDKKGL